MELLDWMVLPLWVYLLTCAIGLLFIDYMWNFTRFDKQGIPGPRPWPLIGNMIPFLRLGFCDADAKWKKQFGNFYGFFRGRKPVLVIHDAKMLESIMIKDFSSFYDRDVGAVANKPMHKGIFFLKGHEWREVRNLMSPTFTSGKLKQMYGFINECGIQLGDNFADLAEQGTNVAVKDLFGAFTMDVIAVTAFGLKVDSQKDHDNEFIKNVKNIFKFKPSLSYIVVAFFPRLLWLVKKFSPGLWPNESIRFFERSIKEIVQQRRQDKVKRVDFLQLLMDAEAVSDDLGGDAEETPGGIAVNSTSKVTKKRLTTDELVAQAFLFFIAGYETTATALQYLSYEFAINPKYQDRAYQEIQDIIGDDDPNPESVSRLAYLEQCVQEALRLHTPVPASSRVATSDTKLGDYVIDKGTVFMVPFHGIHLNSEYYPDPEVFNPDRFSPEAKAARAPILFTPFGNGPRICIGQRLALIEAKIAMVHVLRKVRLLRCDETEVPLTYRPTPVLMTKTPVKVGVKRR